MLSIDTRICIKWTSQIIINHFPSSKILKVTIGRIFQSSLTFEKIKLRQKNKRKFKPALEHNNRPNEIDKKEETSWLRQ